MSTVNATSASLVASLAIQPGQLADTAVPAAGGDTRFKALLSIGGEDAPSDDRALREESAKEDKDRRNPNQDAAYPVAAVVPVTQAVVADSIIGQRAQGSQAEVSDAAPVEQPAPLAADKPAPEVSQKEAKPVDSPAKPQEAQADKPVDSANASAGDEAVVQDAPAPEENLQAAIADQLGNIGQILETLIQILSGGAVAGQAVQADIPDEKGVTPVLDTVADVNAVAQTALFKDIVSIVRDLKQALLHVKAEGGGSVVVVQQQVSVSLTQVQVGVSNQPQPALPQEVSALLDKLNGLLAKLMPSLAVTADNAVDGAVASVDAPQLAQLKTQLKESIAVVRSQLEQLSVQNETVYASALSRFQAQLGVSGDTKENAPQGDALLKEMLALMAKAPAADKEATPAASALAATASNVTADKAPQVTTPLVIAPVANVQDSNASGNNSGGQQGGNNQAQTNITGVAAASAGQSASAADGTFARALSLTSGRPIPEQVSMHIKTAMADGSSKISIQLDPEDLGKLEIKMNVKADGKTGITITADNSTTLNLLQRDSQNLLRALSDAGLQADSGSLSFNLRGDQQQGGQGNSQMAGNYQKAQPGEDEEVLTQVVNRQYTLNLNDGLDITI